MSHVAKKRKVEPSNEEEDDIKSESGSDGEFEEFDEKFEGKLSEIELNRLENIKRNQEMFDQVDIKSAKQELSIKRKSGNEIEVVGLQKPPKQKIDYSQLPRRSSLRIQKIKAEEVDVTVNKTLSSLSTRNNDDGWNVRKPAEVEMKCTNEVPEGTFESLIKVPIEDARDVDKKYSIKDNTDATKYKDTVSKFKVTQIAKVTRDRFYSMAWYPSSDRKIICSGDKKGKVSMWNLDAEDKNGVFVFDVHAKRPINCLAFCQFDYTKIYSCSYDGTFTCGDITKLMFSQTYVDPDETDQFQHFSFPRNSRNTAMISTSGGDVITVDLTSGKAVQTLNLSGKGRKSVRCVDCHPVNEYLFATSLNDGSLTTWDRRNISAKGSGKSLSTVRANKTIVKAFFSPITGNKLLMTSQDDHLRVYDVNESGIIKATPRHPIKHENYYGRWLTTFRASWDPKTDHSFVVGSMKQPRRIDVFGCDNSKTKSALLSYSLRCENFNFVSSINEFHPQLDMLASGNSSGNMYIWS